MNLQLALLLGYSALLIGIGIWIGRRVSGTRDFFVAGRSLGPGLIFSTMLAANIGAGSTVGATALGYSDLLGGVVVGRVGGVRLRDPGVLDRARHAAGSGGSRSPQKIFGARDDRAVRLGVGLNALGLLIACGVATMLGAQFATRDGSILGFTPALAGLLAALAGFLVVLAARLPLARPA
jgi:Na+/proline symporter